MPPTALITGASRGIGRAVAIALGKLSYRLALVARSLTDLEETSRQASPDDVLLLPADVSSFTECRHAVEKTARHFSRLDALVNVAGLAPVRTIEQTSPEEWRQVIDTNLSSVFYLTRCAWPHLKQAGESGGRASIVNISSVAARDPFAGFAAYGAAKAGLNLFTLAAAREGQPYNIAVHAVAPGAVETDMFRQIMTRDEFPSDQTLDPAEVAEVVVQCVTGQLRHTSGEVIYLHKTV